MRWAPSQRLRTPPRAPLHPGSPGPVGAGAGTSAAGPAQHFALMLRVPRPRDFPGPATARAPNLANAAQASAREVCQVRLEAAWGGAAGRVGRGPADGGVGGAPSSPTCDAGSAAAAASQRRAGGNRLQPADPLQSDCSRGSALAAGMKVPRTPPDPLLGAAGAARSRRTAGCGAEEARCGGEAESVEGKRERKQVSAGRAGTGAPQPAVTRCFSAQPPPMFQARRGAEKPGSGGRSAAACTGRASASPPGGSAWGAQVPPVSPALQRGRLALSLRPGAGRGTGLRGRPEPSL